MCECVCVCIITTTGKFWAHAGKAGTHQSWFDHVDGGTFEICFLVLSFSFGGRGERDAGQDTHKTVEFVVSV